MLGLGRGYAESDEDSNTSSYGGTEKSTCMCCVSLLIGS